MSRIINGAPLVAVALVACLATARSALAAESALPEPLTLEYALSLAEEAHPATAMAVARVEAARAGIAAAEARDNATLTFEGRARWVEPAEIAADQDRGDHRASLFLRKNLHDFGRTGSLKLAAEAELQGQQFSYQSVVAERRVEIMRRFFDVLIADLEFARDNEAMAVAYVGLDKLRDRHELGQVSDIVLLESENAYQQVRRQQQASQARQRMSRGQLAEALNRPTQLPARLALPDLPVRNITVPDYEAVVTDALAQNPLLGSLREELNAAEGRLLAARAGKRPLLAAELEASAYARELGSNDPWRAGVVLTVPLMTGGSVDATVAQHQAAVHQARARLRQAEHDVRQAVLEQWLELQNLPLQRAEARSLLDFRELYLDRSRAMYEMEVSTDLGDAMVKLSEAELATARADFQTALAWARLDNLTGGRLGSLSAAQQETSGQ